MRQRQRQRQSRQKYQKRTQSENFSSKYDFAYVGRGTVNQLGKIATGLITIYAPKSIRLPSKE